MKFPLSSRAFTLPELIVVIGIIAILSTLGFITYTQHTSKVRDAARSSDLKNIGKTLALYNASRASYPSPSDAINITYSGATVWSQWVFWKKTQAETGKIFGDLQDPLYKNQYTYSTTANKKEYQISAIFENEDIASWLVSWVRNQSLISSFTAPNIIETAHASNAFEPSDLSPIIWLEANDVDGDGDTSDNPWNGWNISTWVNKWTLWIAGNPTITQWNLRYATQWVFPIWQPYPWVFISRDTWLLLNGSEITSGDIYYFVNNHDPFGSTDTNGRALQSANSDKLIGFYWRYAHALYMNGAPNHRNRAPATRNKWSLIYSFHTDDTNYEFRDFAWNISQWATNSISWDTWAFNKAWWASSQSADWVVSDIIIFDQKLSSDDRLKMEGYFAHKYNVLQGLPSNHPYK